MILNYVPAVVARLIGMLCPVLLACPLFAATLAVSSLADGPPQTDGICTLREAVLSANNDTGEPDCMATGAYGDDLIVLTVDGEIQLSGAPDEDANLSGDLDISDDLTITNISDDFVVVSGESNDRVFDLRADGITLTLDRMRVVFGQPPASGTIEGGGIRSMFAATSIVLNDCILAANTVEGDGINTASGGGIYSVGDILVHRSEFLANDALNTGAGIAVGGAIRISGSGNLTVTDSRFFQNRVLAEGVVQGGAIDAASSGQLFISGTELSFNTATSNTGNAFSGAISSVGADLELVNTTISSNTVTAFGAGQFAQNGALGMSDDADLVTNNTTIAFNEAVAAAGTALFGGINVSSTATGNRMANTILTNNADGAGASNCNNGANITSLGHNMINGNCGVVAVAGDQFGINPNLLGITDNGGLNAYTSNSRTHAPMPGSLAIDMGNPASPGAFPACGDRDQRGFGRPADGGVGAVCDIGAHEVAAVTPLPGALQFQQPDYPVSEDDGSVAVIVERIGGADGDVDVDYFMLDDTATDPDDYIAATGTLSFADGVTTQVITVSIMGDMSQEGPEAFTVFLAGHTGGAVLGTPDIATVSITDGVTGTAMTVPGLTRTGAGLLVLAIALMAARRVRKRVPGAG